MEEIMPFTPAVKTITHRKLNAVWNVQEVYKENCKTNKVQEMR